MHMGMIQQIFPSFTERPLKNGFAAREAFFIGYAKLSQSLSGHDPYQYSARL
jgi:hypothetical protein